MLEGKRRANKIGCRFSVRFYSPIARPGSGRTRKLIELRLCAVCVRYPESGCEADVCLTWVRRSLPSQMFVGYALAGYALVGSSLFAGEQTVLTLGSRLSHFGVQL